jgi:hypothetical protein
MTNATLTAVTYPTIICEHCHQRHEVTMEVWTFNGVNLTRYLTPCQGKPVYGFAY